MSNIDKLLENNKQWAEKITQQDPEFFPQLAKQQTPEYLWIGCSDSRVPASQVVNLLPGEMFVHRNIANQVIHTDFSCLSVLQYAVEVLKVKHIIICGHYGCGGVEAALGDQQFGLIDNWLRHIKDSAAKHKAELDALEGAERSARMCELNVLQQAENVASTTIVKDALKRGQSLTVHSWIYDLKSGELVDLAA